MLQEMGVTVWGPSEGAAAAAPAPVAPSAGASAQQPPAPRAAPAVTAPPLAAPTAPSASSRAPATAPVTAPAPAPASAMSNPAAGGAGAPALRLHAAQALYPQADPAQAPAELGAGWLIVTESTTPGDPLAGDAGKLLDNMLRAMQLHKHPRVFIAALERSATGALGTDAIPDALADTVARLQPAMVLVLGHVAARAALGRTEPLGRLRAELHQLAGCPAVVSYDPAFLLRSQEPKAAAWADLCRALATVRARL
ncbi:MAG: hypothetical protein EON49_20720, partial [Acidovorax sp.]